MKHVDLEPGDRVVAYLKAGERRPAGMIAELVVADDDGRRLVAVPRRDRLPDLSDGYLVEDYQILAKIATDARVRYAAPSVVRDACGERVTCHATVEPHHWNTAHFYDHATDPSGRYVGALHYDIGTVRFFDPVAVMAEALRRAMAYEEAGASAEGPA